MNDFKCMNDFECMNECMNEWMNKSYDYLSKYTQEIMYLFRQ